MNLPSRFRAFAIAFVCGLACYWIAGNSLDLFIGGVCFTAILVPPFSAIAGRSPGGVLAITGGIGCCWFMPVHAGMVTVWQWAVCMMVLLSFAALLMAGVQLLLRFGLSPVTVSAVVTIGVLAWLSWPVWLSGSLVGDRLHWSVVCHPLFAINHVVAGLGIWTEQQGAYGLTNLGQDVQYQLPYSAWPVIGLQFGLAAVMSLRITNTKSRVTK